jgi:hypothetical protein
MSPTLPAIYDAYKLVQAYTGIVRILVPHNPGSRFYNHDIDHKISPLFVERARTLRFVVNATHMRSQPALTVII